MDRQDVDPLDPTGSLFTRVKAGDRQALDRFLELLHPYVRQMVRQCCAKGRESSLCDFDDFVQETLAEVLRSIDCSDTEPMPFELRAQTANGLLAWVRRIVHCRIAEHHRAHRRAKRDRTREVPLDNFQDFLTHEAPERRIAQDETARAVRAAVKRLPSPYRRLVFLRYIRQLSFDDLRRYYPDRRTSHLRVLCCRGLKLLAADPELRGVIGPTIDD